MNSTYPLLYELGRARHGRIAWFSPSSISCIFREEALAADAGDALFVTLTTEGESLNLSAESTVRWPIR